MRCYRFGPTRGGFSRSSRRKCLLAALLLAATAGLASAAGPVEVQVVEDTGHRIVLQYELGDFAEQPVHIDGQEYVRIALGKESPLTRAGAPELPNVCRSIIIPDDARMAVGVISSEFYEITGLAVVPSKGILSRKVNPDDVPYVFGEVYDTDAYYPGELVSLREPYILRDHRGVVVELNPFQYNPVTRTLRVYSSVTVQVLAAGPGQVNVLRPDGVRDRELNQAFHQVYGHHFLNYGPGLRYDPLDEQGDMLIIYHDAWLPNIQPLVDHKNMMGISTTAVAVSVVGNDAIAIKDYIQDAYDSGDLAFVLLVGDVVEVDTPTAADNGAADPTYALVAGADHYPDIFVGRFSAETAAEVDTQVLRTIEYEQMPGRDQDWFKKGVGIASAQGAGVGDDGEADWEHMDNIRIDLLGDGYDPVDQIYATTGGTSADVSNAVNAGRGIINYCGHGAVTKWVTTGFSNTHVNALTNDNVLPFIISVACQNGHFDGYTCFAEAWLRATHGGEPTGAVGMYASSIDQDWQPPMCAQDEIVDLLVSDGYFSFGALCFAGACQMMDEYGSGAGSSGRDNFDTWHVFGDPSLEVVYRGPRPPGAQNQNVSTALGTAVTITLVATDEGLPDPPAALEYIITALPTCTLWDAGDHHVITAEELPYTLIGEQVTYKPDWGYEGPDSFVFQADDDGAPPDGGLSNAATVSITVGGPQPVHQFPMDQDPGWAVQAQWAFGQPTGDGSYDGDPSGGHTGSDVYGYNLNGDYANNMSDKYLTTTAIDCSGMTEVQLRFWRWLGVESSSADGANIQVSKDGMVWLPMWEHSSEVISDSSWTLMELDLPAWVDGQETVYIRWGMGPTNDSITYPGWNIDDVEIWGVLPAALPGDYDQDSDVDLGDYASLHECMAGPGADPPTTPSVTRGECLEIFDFEFDGDVDLADCAEFQRWFTGTIVP